jgi:hypothetical protein
MKAIGVIFLTLGCAARTVGTAYPAQSVVVSQQEPPPSTANAVGNHSRQTDHAAPAGVRTQTGKPAEAQQNQSKVSGNKPPTANASPTKSSHRNEVPNMRERSLSAASKSPHRPGSDKSGGAAQNGLARNETASHAPSKRAPNAVRPSGPALSNVRHRGANPAIVGGVGTSNTRNSGALDGTHMNRRRIGN